jgi:CheY-like chemotaxis protein
MDGYLCHEHTGRPLINIADGNIVAILEDVLIDPDTQHVSALVTLKGNWLGDGPEAVPSEQVRVWGHDAVLVSQPDAVRVRQLPDVGKWLSVTKDLKGRVVTGTDGFSACRHVRSRSSVPLVVVGPNRLADTAAALQLGADDYVPRPVSHRELLAHVRAVLRRARWQLGSVTQ